MKLRRRTQKNGFTYEITIPRGVVDLMDWKAGQALTTVPDVENHVLKVVRVSGKR